MTFIRGGEGVETDFLYAAYAEDLLDPVLAGDRQGSLKLMTIRIMTSRSRRNV